MILKRFIPLFHAIVFSTACCKLTKSSVVEETIVAKYSRINADGTWLYSPLFNGTLPGPAVECTKGDTLKITVVNEMKKEELSVNWQAFIQSNTNHMDGVPYITEYPISPDGGSRVYEFVAEKAGTFHYHSNQEFIKMSLHGIIIVRDPDESLEYDEDLIAIQNADASSPTYPALVATDWYHKGPETLAAQLDNNIGDWIWQPQSSIINGFGMHDCSINKNISYYFRCTWQCPGDDLECIDEVRCSKAKHPFNGATIGPYIFEENYSLEAYNALIASSSNYTQDVQDAWANKCGWDHLLPFLAGSSNEQVVDGQIIGETGVHQNQFLNWGRKTGLQCNVPPKERDSRCLADGTWPFKGMNKGRVYDHLRNEDGTYDIHHFDEDDLSTFGSLCRPTRFYTADYQPESNHHPFGLWSHSTHECHSAAQKQKMNEMPAIFEVEAGKTYRLRIVNAATLIYSTLVIEGHVMKVIDVDGNYIDPFETNFLDLWNGQSYSVLITADATPGDYWIGLSPRHRGYTRIDPGRAILRYVVKSDTGSSTAVVPEDKQLPSDATRPVPKWWDAAGLGSYQDVETGKRPTVCPKEVHKSIYDANRNMTACPGFYPHFADQDISMKLQYKFMAKEGSQQLPTLSLKNGSPVMIVQNMNVNGVKDMETYKTCMSDYGGNGIPGTYWTAYSYAGNAPETYDPKYGRFLPNTNIAGSAPECGVQRWSVNNITYARSYPYSYDVPLLKRAYEGTLDDVPGLVDVKRPDETPYFSSFPEKWYTSIDPSHLGGNSKADQGIPPSSNELINVMKFPLGEVFDVVMQNTVYLKFWTNAFYGNKHNHRQGSNHHPYHSHGFDFWILGYGEGNFDTNVWNGLKVVDGNGDNVEYEGGIVYLKNTVNPPKQNLAVNFAGGWTVLRIKADNPGLWWFHCTVMSHWHMGMGATFGFGLNELPKPNPFPVDKNQSKKKRVKQPKGKK